MARLRDFYDKLRRKKSGRRKAKAESKTQSRILPTGIDYFIDLLVTQEIKCN